MTENFAPSAFTKQKTSTLPSRLLFHNPVETDGLGVLLIQKNYRVMRQTLVVISYTYDTLRSSPGAPHITLIVLHSVLLLSEATISCECLLLFKGWTLLIQPS